MSQSLETLNAFRRAPVLYAEALALEVSSGEISDATARTYQTALRRFLTWVEGGGDAHELRLYVAALRARYAPATVNLWIYGLRHFLAWGVAAGHLGENPARKLKGARRGQAGRFRREPLANSEVRRLLGLEGLSARDRAILFLLVYTGVRQIEVTRADLSDLGQAGEFLSLAVQGKGQGDKGERVIIASSEAQAALRAYLAARGSAEGALFLSSRGGRLSLRSLRSIVKRAIVKAGIIGAKSTHSLRHTALSNALANGATLADVQAMARHSSAATTLRYLHQVTREQSPAEARIKYD